MANNNSNVRVSGGGIGFSGALTILFIALKLIGVIEWSWVWVLAPLWISFGIGVIIFVIAFIVGLLIRS